MSTPYFEKIDKKINFSDVLSWPKSPDRTAHGSGREAYADEIIQEALSLTPPDSSMFSYEMSDILDKYKSFKLGNAILYENDPIPELIKKLHYVNLYFEDETFPPSQWKGGSKVSHKRIHDICASPEVFINGISFKDMCQRGLGNCGFVSSIGVISVHPQGHNLLFSSIYPCVYNPYGVYSVRIIDGNRIGYVLIDDLFPTAGFSSMLNSNEFWYLIIEKAISKISGGYGKLGGGKEGYFGIESTANTSISDANKDDVWKSKFINIFQHEQHATYQGTGSKNKYITKGHAFAVIDAQEWNGIRLVRLHNPWNNSNPGYQGPYSPGSKEWDNIPKDIQESVFQVNRWDGYTFWMPYDLYVSELPKISDTHLSAKIPETLKEIANTSSIQG